MIAKKDSSPKNTEAKIDPRNILTAFLVSERVLTGQPLCWHHQVLFLSWPLVICRGKRKCLKAT